MHATKVQRVTTLHNDYPASNQDFPAVESTVQSSVYGTTKVTGLMSIDHCTIYIASYFMSTI